MNIKQNLKGSLSWDNIRLNLLICAGITILLTFFSWQHNQGYFLKVLFITFIYAYLIGFSIYFTMTIFFIQSKKRLIKYLIRFFQICIGTVLGMVIANLIFTIIYGSSYWDINFSSLGFLLLSGVFFTTVALSIFYYFRLSEDRKYKHLQEQQKKTKAELRALVAQINPHFLFNTLNSISSLIHINQDKADEMIQKLSDVFRYSLQSGKKRFVSLNDEINVVEKYLEIEKVRFENRLDYVIQMDESCKNCIIPPLILQTLVENSVKHGISPKIEGGKINISVKDKDDDIEIKIEDNGVGIQNEVEEGFGLDAVRNILKLQFAKQDFELRNENGVKIRIIIPKMEIKDEI